MTKHWGYTKVVPLPFEVEYSLCLHTHSLLGQPIVQWTALSSRLFPFVLVIYSSMGSSSKLFSPISALLLLMSSYLVLLLYGPHKTELLTFLQAQDLHLYSFHLTHCSTLKLWKPKNLQSSLEITHYTLNGDLKSHKWFGGNVYSVCFCFL